NAPSWENLIYGHINLRDAINKTISYQSPEGKSYRLNDKVATLMVRPRGWHLPEKHVLVDGKQIPGGIFDFGLYFFHNVKNLIETILAAFEMDEILYEIREHSAGLNCGRWDYIFSFIKKFRNRPDFVLPDRAQVTMNTHFLKSYSLLLIQTCHRRGAHAMGGMAAQIPIKDDPAANDAALAKVREDKRREAGDGHDGTWVAHPALVAVAREEFDAAI